MPGRAPAIRCDGHVSRPTVIAHRGASGLRPEHTRSAYLLGIEQGADFIEPDVVATRDGVLVVRHENEISGTTDVAERPEFADRRTTKTVDGRALTGWFTEDLTLAELRTLRTRERMPELRPGNVAYAGTEPVLTFAEVVRIAVAATRATGRSVGVYVEIKHPTYFAGLGLDLGERVLEVLAAHHLDGDRPEVPVVIQSMEPSGLRRLRSRTSADLVQLVSDEGAPWDLASAGDPRSYRDLLDGAGLGEIAAYADGIGPHKDLVIARGDDERWTGPTGLVDRARAAGLFVHPWTVRAENRFLPADLRRGERPGDHGEAAAECVALFDAGVDGVFSDFPGIAVAAGRTWTGHRS